MMQESPEKIRDKMYDIEVENKASNPFEEILNPVQPAKPQGNINLDQQQNLEDLPKVYRLTFPTYQHVTDFKLRVDLTPSIMVIT